MARRVWRDRIVERPRTFTIQNNADGTITLIPAPGKVIDEGVPVNETNLNGLEDDLETHLAETTRHRKIILWNGTDPQPTTLDGDILIKYKP